MTGHHRGSQPAVAVVMGSDSDWPVMQAAVEVLAEFGVAAAADVVSAHRMPAEMISYGQSASNRGLKVIIQIYLDSAPDWVGVKYPDGPFVDRSGTVIQSQSAPGFCIDHAGVRQLMGRVGLEFDPFLKVDQIQLNLGRAVGEREIRDERVQQRRFARASLAGDQHVL